MNKYSQKKNLTFFLKDHQDTAGNTKDKQYDCIYRTDPE